MSISKKLINLFVFPALLLLFSLIFMGSADAAHSGGIVNVSCLHFREEPNTTSASLALAYDGDEVIITGQEGDGYGMDYPTSKAGLMFGLTKSIAQFGAPYGIRSVCISPGPVLTRPDMAKMKTMLGRAAEPQEIIDLCLYVISDKGQFINGENIMIDGGRNAMGRYWGN